MKKRTIKLGTYDTATHGWTLASCVLSPAEQKTNFVDKPGGDGSHDLSTAMTDGIPRYYDRTLTVTLECSDGDRLARKAKLAHMVNRLDGMRVDIVLPDDAEHYLTGRLHVAPNFNDLAHTSVTVTATCMPWLYDNDVTGVMLDVTAEEQTVIFEITGRRAVVPNLTVVDPDGTGAQVRLVYGSSSISLSPGRYQWPDLLLTHGEHEVTYSGSGKLLVDYREAVLE